MAGANLSFDVSALDSASKTFVKLAAVVSRFEARLDKLDGKRIDVEAEVSAKTDQADREIGNFARDMQRRISAAVRALPDIELDADASQADRELAAVRAELDALSRKTVGVDIDAAAADAELRRLNDELRRLGTGAANVQVKADTAAALAALKVVDAEVDHLDGRTANVRVDIDRSLGETLIHLTRLGGALKALAIPAALVAAAPQIASLGAAAVTASGALYLIPAAGVAAAAGIGALTVGLHGFGDAMKALAKGDAAKFAEALKKLSPDAQQAALEVKGLGAAWREVQQATQQELFRGAADAIRDLGSKYLPVLRTGLSGIAAELSGAGKELAAFLGAARTTSSVATIFDNTAKATKALSPGLVSVSSILRDIATVGSSFLPRLADGLSRAAARAAEFIAKARDSGQLAEWIQRGIDTLAQLGRIAGDAGSALGSIFDAARSSGADFLGTVERITQGVADFLRSAQGQTALTSLFREIRSAVDAAAPGVKALASAVAGVVTQLADSGVLTSAAQAFTAVAAAAAPVLRDLGELASVVLPPLLAVVRFLAPALVPVAAAFAGIVAANKGLSWLSGLSATFAAIASGGEGASGKLKVLADRLGGLKAIGGQIAIAIAIEGIDLAVTKLHELADQIRTLPEPQRSGWDNFILDLDAAAQQFNDFGARLKATNWADFIDPGGQMSAKWQGLINMIKGTNVPPIKLDADGTLARAKLTEIMNLVNSATPTVNINGRTEGAAQALADIVQAINAGQGSVKINGVDTPVQEALSRVREIINSTMGYVQVNGETKLAGDALVEFVQQAQGQKVTVPVGADTGPAESQIRDGVGAALAGVDAKVPVAADTAPAAQAIAGLGPLAAATQATVTINGNALPANEALAAVVTAVNAGVGTITVNGQTMPAQQALAAVLAQVNAGAGTVTINGQSVPAQQVLAALIAAVNAGSGTVTINGQSVPASQALQALLGQVNSSGGTIRIGADGSSALSTARSIQATINGMRATIKVGSTDTGNIVPRAAGAYARPAYMASGGLRRMSAGRAEIVPPRQPRVIGDRMQGDEAFIPINGSGRSRRILSMAASKMGYDLVERIRSTRSDPGGVGSGLMGAVPAPAGVQVQLGPVVAAVRQLQATVARSAPSNLDVVAELRAVQAAVLSLGRGSAADAAHTARLAVELGEPWR